MSGSYDDGVNIHQLCIDFFAKAPLCLKFLQPSNSSEPLRLVAFDTDGTLFVWEWDQEKYVWSSVGSVANSLPFPVESFDDYQFAYDPQNKFVLKHRSFCSLILTFGYF